MLSQEDLKQIAEKGITEDQIKTQLEEFKTGFPFLKLEAAASIGRGILALDKAKCSEYESAWKEYKETGKRINATPLIDWSKSADNAVKYYSGHATYQTTFRLRRKPKGVITLDLGTVANTATVYVNGVKCGTAWTAPFAVDITKAVKRGTNTLKITVVNTWANALQGNDLGTPPFEGIWTNGKYRRAEKELLPAGLLGPVKIQNQY